MTDSSAEPEEALAPASRVQSRWRVGIGAALILLVLGVAAAVVVEIATGGGGVEPVAAATPAAGAIVTPAPAQTSSATVVVQVVGHVNKPGVYELPGDARVIDAVGSAGGFSADADQGGLNLARVLTDGEQIVVPKPGDPPPPSADVAAAGTSGASTATGSTVDLNTATLEQLETLPRVGPAMAQRILDWRTQNGRFATIQDLKNVTGIGDKIFADLQGLVTAR